VRTWTGGPPGVAAAIAGWEAGGRRRRRGCAKTVSGYRAEAAEREAFAAIGRLGEIEFARVKEWVAGECRSPRPVPDKAESQRLTEQLAAATAAREAAENAAGSAWSRAKANAAARRLRRAGPPASKT
jgi:hypothetical protein